LRTGEKLFLTAQRWAFFIFDILLLFLSFLKLDIIKEQGRE
jgi:hypothetical protein